MTKLRKLCAAAVSIGCESYEDLQEPNWRLVLPEMVASAIREAGSESARWEYINESGEDIPHLLADALAFGHGDHLGLRKTDELLVEALKRGAARYAESAIREVLGLVLSERTPLWPSEEEADDRRDRARDLIAEMRRLVREW